MLLLLIKFLVAVIGLILIMRHLILGVVQHNNLQIKKSGKLLLVILGFFTLAIALEFALKQFRNRGLIMYAWREAPTGGIWLKLYDNQEFHLGYLPTDKEAEGRFKFHGDTLFLEEYKPNGLLKGGDRTSLIIMNGMLVEIDRKSLGTLEITMNQVKKD
ncbi:hypothetical protein [Rufibacter psychrotolerans]|uniref:hypothetical protein n=1 Tax=Rufibacter psychrotolerans TaxID=2812556 RepID=UPI0019689EAD|nr:hypothetical protein [Rufibacter sp. SYSU D00308]